MRKFISLITIVTFCSIGYGQSLKGKIIKDFITSSLLHNEGGENTTRRLTIYLPPKYDETNERYPVLYYLHGFTMTDSLTQAEVDILDLAINSGKIRPIIFVVSNQNTNYEGSFYSNSTLNGNWADFTAKAVVEYVDNKFRTISNRNSRGICGHSMGGYGAIKLAMLFPDIFSSVYALSPGFLALVKEFGPNSESYKQLALIKNKEDLKKLYFPKAIVAVARAWSPNLSNPPFYCDVQFKYKGDSLIVDNVVLDKWNKNLPIMMIDNYIENIKKLKAIKLDWGRNDGSRFPVMCMMFSQKLENLGIEHFAEEYIGTHMNKIWTIDGRVLNSMLPFFNTYLTFKN